MYIIYLQAILYYTFAALQGLPEAEMAMAFRYWAGIGVKEDCMRALDWYESVAHQCESKGVWTAYQSATLLGLIRVGLGIP
jgi:TPR repeat protein